jgi:hypothetical protein
MNQEWADKNKKMQALLGKEASFREGIEVLIELRNDLFGLIASIAENYPPEAFSAMPFAGAKGYQSKTLAYSMWHIFRIEDVVAHTLIRQDAQILFAGGWQERIKSPLITTGNELQGAEIAAFSEQMDVKALCEYCKAVMESTNGLLRELEYKDLKRRFSEEDRQRLIDSRCVSTDENAFWLIDYWCGKNLLGLLKMPFSRHWIMHVEAMCRIKNKLCQRARKGVDPIAYCGLSCDHCFLTEWCGSCRTAYNACSYATCSPNGICPTAACCKEKGIDGCWACDGLRDCRTGFYASAEDTNAIKALAMFIGKYGKQELLTVLDRLHQTREFQVIQEIIGLDPEKGLQILEENRLQ